MPASAPAARPRQTSADGHELRFAVNYLAGFLLTHLLLPAHRESAPARIVNVSSAGQQAIDFDDVMLTRGYSGARAYCQSKLAQIMFTIDLARRARRHRRHRQRAASGDLHEHDHGPPGRRDAHQQRRAGRRGDPQACGVAGARRRSGRYFNGLREARADAAGLRRGGAPTAQGDQPGAHRSFRPPEPTPAGSVRSTRSAAPSGTRSARPAGWSSAPW